MSNTAEQQPQPSEETPQTEAPGDVAETDDSALKIAALEKKLAEATDKMLRALAEADNTRKRLEKERLDTARFAISSFARDLLTVSDNLRRALNAISPEMREKNAELKNIYTGVEATERELLRIFESNGIKKVDPTDQKFDPNLHEVIFETDVTDKAPGTVVQVIEQGYTLHDRLLRPARVGVAKGGADSSARVDQEV